jgi:secondary thiamine-phosphate synthase enzyme
MKTAQKTFNVSSGSRNQMIDVTDKVHSVLKEAGITDGQALVYCPHTTAAITINENADPSVTRDILMMLSELIPANHSGFKHMEGNSDSHCKSSIIGCSETVLISDGKLQLGTWQGVYFCEFDGPRSRRFIVQVSGT